MLVVVSNTDMPHDVDGSQPLEKVDKGPTEQSVLGKGYGRQHHRICCLSLLSAADPVGNLSWIVGLHAEFEGSMIWLDWMF